MSRKKRLLPAGLGNPLIWKQEPPKTNQDFENAPPFSKMVAPFTVNKRPGAGSSKDG